uniref:Uncharacterized protein n=1 Tax=Opuntia streptacantha TaxID=393608 RepID=A0A7C8YG74_OPUST
MKRKNAKRIASASVAPTQPILIDFFRGRWNWVEKMGGIGVGLEWKGMCMGVCIYIYIPSGGTLTKVASDEYGRVMLSNFLPRCSSKIVLEKLSRLISCHPPYNFAFF